MTRRQLKRAIREAWSRYVNTLKDLYRQRGGELTGLERAHRELGSPADAAYTLFQEQQQTIQDEFGAVIDARFLAKAKVRQARDAAVQARRQAEHDVAYFTEYLARELVRARAVVKFAGATEEEAMEIVAAARDKLTGAQRCLEALHEETVI